MFDPLHKWLGIPPDEQPPNHYRLLGVARFEADDDVIDAAADKQLAYLHNLTNGEFAEQAEQLSNQVSAARVCLLSPEKKKAYDTTLRSHYDRLNSAPPDRADPAYRVAPLHDPSSESLSSAPGKISRTKKRSQRSSVKRFVNLSIVLCVIALVLVGVGIQQGRLVVDLSVLEPLGLGPANRPEPTSDLKSAPESEPTRDPASKRSTSTTSLDARAQAGSPNRPRNDRDRNRTPSTGNPSGSPTTPIGAASTRDPRKPPRQLSDLLHSNASGSESVPIVKRPLPSESQVEEKMGLIRELYQKEYKQAQTPETRIELAKLMHREGQDSAADPVGRFALWKVAREIMIREGEFKAAIDIADNVATHYLDVDAGELKIETLEGVVSKISTSRMSDFINMTTEVVNQCIDDEQFDQASLLCAFIQRSTKADPDNESDQNDPLDAKLKQLQRRVQDSQSAFDASQRALVDLENSIDDPSANQAMGRYLCFIRGDWKSGLIFLSRGDNPATKEAAKRELDTKEDALESIDVADAWFDIAESEEGETAQANIRLHALERYRSLREATDGLQRRKVAARIVDLEQLLPNELIARLVDSKIDSSIDDAKIDETRILQYRVTTSRDSRSDFVERKVNTFTMGMGSRPDGKGEVAAGIELQGVEQIMISGSASHSMGVNVNAYSKTGFFIDYHTPGGYVKRVFLGLGLSPGRRFDESPVWGTAGRPDVVTDIGRQESYEIDFRRWAPSTWDGRCWITIYMRDAGPDRTINATVSW